MGKELQMQCTETTCICQTSRSSRQPHASMVLLEKGTEAKPLKEALGASETGQHQHGRFWKSDPRERTSNGYCSTNGAKMSNGARNGTMRVENSQTTARGCT